MHSRMLEKLSNEGKRTRADSEDLVHRRAGQLHVPRSAEPLNKTISRPVIHQEKKRNRHLRGSERGKNSSKSE